jgi:hypothetical protein
MLLSLVERNDNNERFAFVSSSHDQAVFRICPKKERAQMSDNEEKGHEENDRHVALRQDCETDDRRTTHVTAKLTKNGDGHRTDDNLTLTLHPIPSRPLHPTHHPNNT